MEKRDNKIYIIDVTNRDGVQTANIILSKLQKTMLNCYLGEMGIYQSECGFPALDHEWNYINVNMELAKQGIMGNMRLSGWVRAVAEDVYRSLQHTNIRHLNLSISTSQIMTEGKFGGRLNREDILKIMAEAVVAARESGVESIGVNAEDASRTEPYTHDRRYDEEYLVRFAKVAQENGADRIRYCDTLGYDHTVSIYDSVKRIAEAVKIPIELHCHNDLGYAVANSVEGAMGAIEAGVDAYINTTVNGVGERAGNADMVSVLLAILKSRGTQERNILDPNIDLTKAWKICNYTSNAFRMPIPINQVGVGANAFAHESGIHADGMLKDRKNYELYSPDEIGIFSDQSMRPLGRVITTGEYGGVKGLLHVYGQMGMTPDNPKELLRLVQHATLHNQMPLTEDELVFIAEHPAAVEKLLTVDPRIGL